MRKLTLIQDLHTILQAFDIPSVIIDILIENYIDWYGLTDDDIESQYCELKKRKIHYEHCSKVKFVHYKVIYDKLSIHEIANYKLQPGEVTYYVNKIHEDLRAGVKDLPLSIRYLSLASKSSPYKTTIQQCEHV